MKKRILALGLVLLMSLSLFAGCGKEAKSENLDYESVVLTVGENEITLREAYFLLKWQQAQYQTMGVSQFGEDWYNQDLTGEGPFIDYIKDSVIAELEEMYILMDNAEKYNMSLTDEDNAKIDEVVSNFLNSNSEEAKAALGVNEEIARKVVTNYTLYAKVYNEIIRDADTAVTSEEAAQKTYSYIYQPLTDYDEEGNLVDMSVDEQNGYFALLESVKADVEDGKTFDEAAEDYGFSTAEHSFGKQSDDSFSDINGLADELKVNEVSEVIPVEGGLFLLHLDTEYDEEATEDARYTIAEEKLMEAFETEYEELKKDVVIELDEELWETATFDNPVVAYIEE